MQRPEPQSGLVIRYDYLWRDESVQGRVEGSKIRPCAVVVARIDVNGVERALVAAITHSKPENNAGHLIPPAVKKHLGLDQQPSWIVTTELNDIEWLDPGIVPVSPKQWAYGFLPPRLMQSILDDIRNQQKKRRFPVVRR